MNQELMNRIYAMMQQRGASGNGIMGYADGGGVPRQTEIAGQPHMLAYINPEEERMLRDAGGTGQPGPGGIPAYPPEYEGSTSFAGYSNANNYGVQYNSPHSTDNDDNNSSAEIAERARVAAAVAAEAARVVAAAEAARVAEVERIAEADRVAEAAATAEILAKYTNDDTSGLDDYSDQLYNESYDKDIDTGNYFILPGSAAEKMSVAENTDLGSLYDGSDTLNAVVDYNGVGWNKYENQSDPYNFDDDDEDYTPTSAELNAAITEAGGVNLTDSEYAEPVDFTKTNSGADFTTVAEADTDVSGFEYGFDPSSGTLASDDSYVAPVVDVVPEVYVPPVAPVVEEETPVLKTAYDAFLVSDEYDPYKPRGGFEDPYGGYKHRISLNSTPVEILKDLQSKSRFNQDSDTSYTDVYPSEWEAKFGPLPDSIQKDLYEPLTVKDMIAASNKLLGISDEVAVEDQATYVDTSSLDGISAASGDVIDPDPTGADISYADILSGAGISDEEIADMTNNIMTQEPDALGFDPLSIEVDVDPIDQMLSELGIFNGDLESGFGDGSDIAGIGYDAGIDLESTTASATPSVITDLAMGDGSDIGGYDLPDDAQDFVTTEKTSAQQVQDLVNAGVDRNLAEAMIGYGADVSYNDPAGIDAYDFGFDGGLTGQPVDDSYNFVDDLPDDALDFSAPVNEFDEIDDGTGTDFSVVPNQFDEIDDGTGTDFSTVFPAGESLTDDTLGTSPAFETQEEAIDRAVIEAMESGTAVPTEDDISGLGSFENLLNTQPIDQSDKNVISNTIKELEGFSDDTYYDVNADRAGYGSDTKTDPVTGEVTKITEGMTVTREEAEADLNRRLTTEFIPSVVNVVGADTFYSMPSTTQAALTSIAYNYGAGWADKLPTLAAAAASGDTNAIADAIEDRSVDNEGINAGRRIREADMVRSGVPLGGDVDPYTGNALSGSSTGASTSNTGIPTSEEISGGSGESSTDLYLSAMDKISADGYDPDKSNLSAEEQAALYGARGQTPNAAETVYLQDLLGDVKHVEDGPIDDRKTITSPTTYGSTFNTETGEFEGSNEIIGGGETTDNPNFGELMYKAGDTVRPETFGDKAGDFIVGVIDALFNPLSILGGKFTLAGQIDGATDKRVEEQLQAYKNGGTFVYDENGSVVGVAEANYDASGDGLDDTVVFYDGDGEIKVTGDGVFIDDVIESNEFADGEEFDIDIVDSDKLYTNTEDGVVETSVDNGAVVDQDSGDDDDSNICEAGFEFDPVEGICMPIDTIGDGTGRSKVKIKDRPVGGDGGGDVTIPVMPRPTTGGVKVRQPSFNKGGVVMGNITNFASGGVVTPNIDNFFASMR